MVLYILLLLWLLVSLTPTCRLYPQIFLPLQTPLGGLISAAANERMLQCKHMYRHHRIRGDHTHILELPARTKQIKTRTLCLNCWAKHLRVSTASIEEYHALRSFVLPPSTLQSLVACVCTWNASCICISYQPSRKCKDCRGILRIQN